MSAKQANNNKLQGSVAAYLRCGGVVHNQIKKSYAESVSEKYFKIGEYLAKLQTRTCTLCHCLVHFLSLLAVCWPGAQSA